MNKTLTTAALPTLGASSYVSPAITAVEVISEGVLCSSFEQYEELEFKWE